MLLKLMLGGVLVLMTLVYHNGLSSISSARIVVSAHSFESVSKTQIIEIFRNLPLIFEVNQYHPTHDIKLPSHGTGYTILGGIGNGALRIIFGGVIHDAFATETAMSMSPDLTGSLSVITQTCEGSGENLECTIEGTLPVENIGTDIAPQSVVKFFLSTDNKLDDTDTFLEEEQVNELGPGESEELNFQALLPSGENAFGEFVIALLDATNVVPESNKENNIVVSPRIIGNELVGCAIGGTVSGVWTATVNVLILLVPAFAIGFRLILKRFIYPNIRR